MMLNQDSITQSLADVRRDLLAFKASQRSGSDDTTWYQIEPKTITYSVPMGGSMVTVVFEPADGRQSLAELNPIISSSYPGEEYADVKKTVSANHTNVTWRVLVPNTTTSTHNVTVTWYVISSSPGRIL